MAVDEEARRGIYEKIEASYGSKVANDMMEHLPQGGADTLARKADLELLRHDLLAEMNRMARSLTLTLTTVFAVFNGIVFAAFKLA